MPRSLEERIQQAIKARRIAPSFYIENGQIHPVYRNRRTTLRGLVTLSDPPERVEVMEFKETNGWRTQRYHYRNGYPCDALGYYRGTPQYTPPSRPTYPTPPAVISSQTRGKKKTIPPPMGLSSSHLLQLQIEKNQSETVNAQRIRDFSDSSEVRKRIYPLTPSHFVYPRSWLRRQWYVFPWSTKSLAHL